MLKEKFMFQMKRTPYILLQMNMSYMSLNQICLHIKYYITFVQEFEAGQNHIQLRCLELLVKCISELLQESSLCPL